MKTIEYNVIVPDRDNCLENHLFFWWPEIPKIIHYIDGKQFEWAKGKEAMNMFNKYFKDEYGSTRLEKKRPKSQKRTRKGSKIDNRSRNERQRSLCFGDQWEHENGNTPETDSHEKI